MQAGNLGPDFLRKNEVINRMGTCNSGKAANAELVELSTVSHIICPEGGLMKTLNVCCQEAEICCL